MTISEILNENTDVKGLTGKAFAVGIDMSENGDSEQEDFTVLCENCRDIRVFVQPRTTVRRYVDGDKTIPVSDFIRVTFCYYPSASDPLQKKLLDAADKSAELRCVCADIITGHFYEAMLMPRITAVHRDDVFGEIMEMELS